MKTLNTTIIWAILVLAAIFKTSNEVTVDDASLCMEETGDCPDGTREVYGDGSKSRMCCEVDKKSEKDMRVKAVRCRPTKCVSHENYYEDSENICSNSEYFTERFINGRQLGYENLMEARCRNSDDGVNDGVAALCCPEDSTSSYLTTTFGAEPNEFPHMAQVRTPGFCSGTVYNKRFIITAAHCVVDEFDGYLMEVSDLTVTLATGNIAGGDDMGQMYKVKKIIQHEDYGKMRGHPEREKGFGRKLNDIALLELDRDIQFGLGIIKALKIAPKNFQPEEHNTQAVIVGWGKIPKRFEWTWLQKSNFLLRNDSSCFDVFNGYWWTFDSMKDQLLCLGGIKDGEWSSMLGRGDQGGPAICRDENGHPVLCGIASFGAPHQKCMDDPTEKTCPPSGFVDVGYYYDWIVKNAGRQDASTLHRPYLNGREIARVTYEHQVHITSDTGKSCGGTLIAQDVAITAAHCIFQGDGFFDDKEMHEGIMVTSANGKSAPVSEAVVSLPGWKRIWPDGDINLAYEAFADADHHKLATDYYHKNDLVLVKLERKLDISKQRLASIPTENVEFPVYAKEVAFANSSAQNGRKQFMERDFKILEQGDCKRRLKRLREAGMRVDQKDMEGLLCGVEVYSGGSVCDRELGGGVFCKGRPGEKSVFCGVQTFRMCERAYPNLFVDLGHHRDWIQQTLRQLT